MKTAEDFKRAIGPADPDFEAAIRRTLQSLSEQKKGERPVKRRFGLVFALIVTMLFTYTAYAASVEGGLMGLLERWRQWMLPEGQEMVKESFIQEGGHDAPRMDFQVMEAVHDGQQLHIYIEARPRGDDLMISDTSITGYTDENGQFVPYEDYLSDRAYTLPPDENGEEQTVTLREIIEESGKGLAKVNFSFAGIWGMEGADWNSSGYSFEPMIDGRYGEMYHVILITDEEEVTFPIVCTYEYYPPEKLKGPLSQSSAMKSTEIWTNQDDPILVTVKTHKVLETAKSRESVYFAQSGVTLERADVVRTPFKTNIMLYWRWDTPQMDYPEFGWIQAYTDPYQQHRFSWGTAWETSDRTAGHTYVQYPAQDTMPEAIRVRYRDEEILVPLEPGDGLDYIAERNRKGVPPAPAGMMPEARLHAEETVYFRADGMRAEDIRVTDSDDRTLVSIRWAWDRAARGEALRRILRASIGEQTIAVQLRNVATREDYYDMIFSLPPTEETPETITLKYAGETIEVKLQ